MYTVVNFQLKMLTVLPEYRRQGLAVLLADKSKQLAESLGYKVIRFNCINEFELVLLNITKETFTMRWRYTCTLILNWWNLVASDKVHKGSGVICIRRQNVREVSIMCGTIQHLFYFSNII